MIRAILNRVAVGGSVIFLGVCWTYAGVGLFKKLTHPGHPPRAAVHFCEAGR